MNALLATLENISGNQKVLFSYSVPIIRYILPVLLNKFKSESNDVKFLSLKIFSDIIMQYVVDDTVFDLENLGKTSAQQDKKQFSTTMLHEIIVQSLLPHWVFLLDEAEPVPLFAMKLLSSITDRSPIYVEAIEKLGIFPTVLDFYTVGHKRLNGHSIKIVKNMIETPLIQFSTLVKYRVIENTLEILQDMLDQKHDWCVDVLVSVLYALIERAEETHLNNPSGEEEFDIESEITKLMESLYSCIELLKNS
jgi:hypothetical protein